MLLWLLLLQGTCIAATHAQTNIRRTYDSLRLLLCNIHQSPTTGSCSGHVTTVSKLIDWKAYLGGVHDLFSNVHFSEALEEGEQSNVKSLSRHLVVASGVVPACMTLALDLILGPSTHTYQKGPA